MNKRLLSMFLALCMIVTMLPVSAMAEEIHTTIGGSGEIIRFAPLTETEIARTLGTAIADLELPETLTATVRTGVPADENPVQDSGSLETATPTTADDPEWEENTVEIPVTWTSPDYDMDTEGAYVFTPVIVGYTVSAPLPELTVTVGVAIMGRGMVAPLSATTYNIWVGGVQVTSDNKADVLGAADGEGATVTYNSDTNTLTLNGATINGTYEGTWIDGTTSAYYGIYADTALKLEMVGDSTITGKSQTGIASIGIYTTGALTISGSGSLYIIGGTGKFSVGIYSADSIAIEGRRVTAVGAAATQTSIGIASNADITIHDGGVEASANTAASIAWGMMATDGFTINDGEVTASGKTGLHTNAAAGSVTISDGMVTANGSEVGIAGAVTVTGGTVTVKSDAKALNGSLTTSGYEGCIVTAGANKNGDGAGTYNAADLATYKYIKVEPGAVGTDVAQIGSTGYPTLQAAVDAVADGETILLLGNISLTEPVTIPSAKASSFTLDLNGKTISGIASVQTTIQHEGGGTLTIQDGGSGGKIANTSIHGAASTIKILNNGSVTLLSGTIETSMGAIANQGSGDVTVSGGTVKSNGPGLVINSTGSGNVMISGGTMESANSAGTAIARGYGSSGKIILSGTAAITAAYRCIFLNGNTSSDPVLEITGGTLMHTGTTGYVIDVLLSNTILVQGGTLQSTNKSVIGNTSGAPSVTVKINIPSGGSATFKGGEKALADGYTLTLENAGVSASENFDGTPSVSYNPANIGDYKYLAFAPANTVNALDLSGMLTAPVKNGTPSTTGIETAQYTGTVAWAGSPSKFLGGTAYAANVTLTAKPGYTFSGLTADSFTFTGASVTHAAGSGNILTAAVTFPSTEAKALASLVVTTPPAKTGYKYGESFDPTGMAVKAAYDDGTEDVNYTNYTVDKTGSLGMDDTTITLTATSTSITATQTITVTRADGPAAPSGVSFSFDGSDANKLMGATALMEYSLNGGGSWAGCAADTDLTAVLGSITTANGIQVRESQTATHLAGAIRTITITQPSAPAGLGQTDETPALNDGAITGVSSLMEYKKSADTSYTAISGSTVTNLAPGTYLVRLKAAGTALASQDAVVVIATFVKATPAATDLDYSLTNVNYDGAAKPVSVTAKSGKALGAITVLYNGSAGSTTAPPINAGTYTVTVNIAESAGYNAVTGLELGSYTINKVAYTGTTTVSASVLVSGQTGATVTLPDLPIGASYGTPTTGGVTMTDMSISGSTLTYTAPTGTAGQTGTITIPVTGATNYNDYNIVVTVTYTAKIPQGISYATATVFKTYGDTKFTNSLTQTTVTGAITYASNNTSVATVNATGEVTILAAGSATITATAAETSTHAQATASYTVTISKKELTLKADDKSMTQGDALPTFTYTTTGLVNDDTVTTAPTMSTAADGTAIGTFDIIISGGVVANAASYDMTYTKGILTVTAVPNYTVTFNPNGGTVSEASRSVASGTAVGALPTPTRSGSYSFDGWYTAASGGTQISASTTVNANVTYYAHWTYTAGGGSGNGGGSSSNDNSSPVIVTPPAPDKPNSPTQGEIKVPGTVDGKGNVTVNITDKTVTDAFDKAFAEAKKNGTEQSGITVVLRVDTGNKTGSNVTVNLPKAVQDTIIAKKIVSVIVVVDNPDIRVGMDLATVKEINKQAKSDVNITTTRTDSGKLTAEAKKAIGSRPAFDLKVNYGNGKAVISFGAGSVSVTIPYTLGANEKAENICAVYVDDKGKIHWLTDSVYDSVEKVLHFRTNHFSTYGIGYKQDDIRFIDIAGHWAKEDIEFVVSRGLFSGTSATAFSPNTDMTRGMFVTALGRLANADVSGYAKSSFSDVKGDAYYMGYIEWANKNNIVNGVGNNKFAPDQSITREQMAVIMSSYAKIIGLTLQENNAENTFADSDKISAYAKDAVKQMQMSGIISGKNGNLFDPQGTATRAEVSAVLHRFVELVISGDIM